MRDDTAQNARADRSSAEPTKSFMEGFEEATVRKRLEWAIQEAVRTAQEKQTLLMTLPKEVLDLPFNTIWEISM